MPARHRVPSWAALGLIAVAAALAYGNSLDGVFVFDDDEAIVRNAFLRSLDTAFTAPPQSALSGRPLVSLSLALNYAVGGLDPIGYHVANVGLHVLVAWILFGVVAAACEGARVPARVRESARPLALATALLWVVHPLTSEVVNYTTVRTESLMALALMATVYAGIRAMRAARPARWYGASVVACIGGALCKETIVVAPLVVLVFDAVFEAGSVGAAWRHRRGYYTSLFATWALVAAMAWAYPRSGAGLASDVSWTTYLLAQAPILVRYLRLVVWPHPLVGDYGRALPVALVDAAPALLLVAGLLALVGVWWRKDARLAFLGTWVCLTLAPTSSLVPIGTEVGAERRMYLPLMALLLLIVLGAWHFLSRGGRRPIVAGGLLVAALVVALSVTTSARNLDYRSRLRLWQSVVDARPQGRAHHNVGIELAAAGRRDEALAQYRLAVAEAPEAHYAIGFMLAESGRPQEAVQEFRRFLQRLPGDALAPRASNMLGYALAELGNDAEAAEAFRATLVMRPTDPDARGGLADALSRQQRWPDAAAAYRAYLELRPEDGLAWMRLGVVLASADDLTGATDALARAVAAQPSSPEARWHFGRVLMEQGRTAEAIRAFREGLGLDPRSIDLSNALAGALAATGARSEAIAQFTQSLAIDPSSADARRGLTLLGALRR